MTWEWHDYRIRGTKKRTGEVIEGTTRWDGLSSLYFVTRADGTQAILSELDRIEVWERI